MTRVIPGFLVGISLFCLLFPAHSHTAKLPLMHSWSYPFPTHKIDLNDSLSINYIDEGTGSHTLVFVHGLGSNLKAWQKNILELSKHYRCIALDLPNYGQSSTGNFPFGMSYFAEVLKDFIDQLEIEKVVLVGHSMGGQTAIHFALNYPDKLSHLVLMAPAGFETFTAQQVQWFEQVYTKSFVKAATEEQIQKNFQLNFFDMPADAQFMISDRLEMKADQDAYDSYCSMIPKCVIGMLKEPVFSRLNEIETPSLVFFGEADQLIPNSFLNGHLKTHTVAQSGVEKMPTAKLVMVPKAGHFVQWEGALVIHQELYTFLEKK